MDHVSMGQLSLVATFLIQKVNHAAFSSDEYDIVWSAIYSVL